MTFREFTGKNVEEAIRAAMAEFSADLGDLDIEILAQGSRGILGVGGEEARILAAPKSAVAAAETIRPEREPDPVRGHEPAREPEPDIEVMTVADVGAEADEEGQADAEPPAPGAVPDAFNEAEVGSALPDRADRPDDGRRTRGGRGRGTRGGRNGRERDQGPREPRGDRPPREPREPRGERTREPAPFVPAKPIEELTDEERATLETARTVLTEMLSLMGMAATVEVATDGDTSRLNVRGDDLGTLIGRRGEKLASLQHIVNLIVGRREGQHHRIAIDVENYRGRREQQLRDVADRAAKRVLQTGKIIQLEAMPAVERRIVHLALMENPRIRTQSVGVEPNRRIVVLPAGQVKD